MILKIIHTGGEFGSGSLRMIVMRVLFFNTITLPVGLKDLRLLHRELHQVSHMWYSLGVQLEIPIGTLKRIKLENNQITECLLEMLTVWLQCANPPPTWNALIEVLESSPMDERLLAQQLRDKYCPKREGGVTGALPIPQGKSLSVPSTVMICRCVMCVDCYVTVYAVRW